MYCRKLNVSRIEQIDLCAVSFASISAAVGKVFHFSFSNGLLALVYA